MTMPDMEQATRFTAAVEAGDEAALRECLSPDLVVWHNNGNVEHHLEQVVRLLLWVHAKVRHLRYEAIRRLPTEHGYVQQHVLRGELAGAAPLEVHACLVVTLVDGLITRIDEYVDSDQVAPLFAP